MTWSRRRILAAGGALAGSSLLLATARTLAATPGTAAGAPGADSGTKRIALSNLHTGEHLEIEYSRDGAYLPAALAAIEELLRDHRNGEKHGIDPPLMDYLVELAHRLGVDPAFNVISGYRSPATNVRLREAGRGVAQRSLHMEGRAIDVRMAAVDCADLAAQALRFERGGVGYYRASNFVHLDTGPFRTWKG